MTLRFKTNQYLTNEKKMTRLVVQTVIVKNPEQKTVYKCGECDFTSTSVGRLQKHKSASGHLSRGTTVNTERDNSISLGIKNIDFRTKDLGGDSTIENKGLEGQVRIQGVGGNEPKHLIHTERDNSKGDENKDPFEENKGSYYHEDEDEFFWKQDELETKSTNFTTNEKRQNRIYPCMKCEKIFKHKGTFKRHDTYVHLKVRDSKCEECSKEFTPRGLSKHMKSVHSTEQYPCPECDYVSKIEISFKFHFDSKHGIKKYQCDKCAKTFGHPTSLNTHIKSKHRGRIFSCEYCAFQTQNGGSIEAHVWAKHKIQNVFQLCPFCDFETQSLSDMEKHSMIHEEQQVSQRRKPPKTLFECDVCDHKVKSKQGLYYHKRSTHEKIFFECDFCEYKATQRTGLKRHVESMHMNIKHICDFCEFQSSTKCALKRHTLKFHLDKVKIFECSKCPFRTHFRSLMNKHLLSKDNKH